MADKLPRTNGDGLPVVPMTEHFPLPVWEDPAVAEGQSAFVGEPIPIGGEVTLPTTPGLGVSVIESEG